MRCPPPVSTVRDLRRNSLAIAGGRSRTKANETEIETTRGRQPGTGRPRARYRMRGRALPQVIATPPSHISGNRPLEYLRPGSGFAGFPFRRRWAWCRCAGT